MEALYSLVQSLNSKEIGLVRSYLQNFYARPNKADAKILKLFDLINDKKRLPDADFLAEKLFQKTKDNAFYKLCSRLKNKILDVLISDSNNEKHKFEHIDLYSIKLRKKLSQFYQLQYSKGNGNSTAYQLLLEIIELSKKYEIYPVLIEALRASKYFKGFIKDFKEYKTVDKKIAFYEDCSKCVYKATDFYYNLIIRDEYFSSNEIKTKSYLKKSISELTKDYKKTKSSIVGYFLHQLQLAYYFTDGDYQNAIHTCEGIKALLNSNKSIYKRSRIAFVYDNMAQCNIFMTEFDLAVENAQNAQKLLSEKSVNYIISKELSFHALFYGGKKAKAKTEIEDIIKKTSNVNNIFRYFKYQYFNANVLFQAGNFKNALKVLNNNSEISRDKSGWDISLRVLKIMCLIELEQFEQASQQIETLRKHMEKYALKDTGKRNLLIFKILSLLERKDFNFKIVNCSEKINLLMGDDKNYRWNYMTPELIPFHQWFLEKKQ